MKYIINRLLKLNHFLAHLAKGKVSFCHHSSKFQFICPIGFRGEDLKKSSNQKQELPVAAMFVNESGQN
jgi:hypothetical protein